MEGYCLTGQSPQRAVVPLEEEEEEEDIYITTLWDFVSCSLIKFTNVSQKTTATIFWAEKYDLFFPYP
jgi:hypothetical protein